MTMFQWPAKEGALVSPYLWVYFAVTIPLTLIVYGAWVWWFRVAQKSYKEQHDERLIKSEKELKQRIRNATTTW